MTEPLEVRIEALRKRADAVRTLNTVPALRGLWLIGREKRALTREVEGAIAAASKSHQTPISAPGLAIGMAQARLSGQAITDQIALQSRWTDLGSLLDWKLSFTLTFLAIYLSVIALVVSFYSCNLSGRAVGETGRTPSPSTIAAPPRPQ